MTLEFYANTSDPRKAVKSIGDVIHTVNNAAIYRECSLMTPEFLIDYSPVVAACNYLYAGVTMSDETYGAYYFIKDRIVMPGGRMVIICAKDVLSTWWHKLKDCTANVIRQENIHEGEPDRFLIDNMMPSKVTTLTTPIKLKGAKPAFVHDTTGASYVVTVIGGTAVQPIESTSKGGDIND